MKLNARLTPDNPWMVVGHTPKDLYRPEVMKYSRMVKEIVPLELTVAEAKERGIDVDPMADPEETIKTTEEIETKVYWSETRLGFNGKVSYEKSGEKIVMTRTSNRQRKFREEMAAAAAAPFQFLPYEELRNMVYSQTDHWKNNNIISELEPIILVMLGVQDSEDPQDQEDRIHVRNTFIIKKYSLNELVLTDSDNKKYTVSFDRELIKKGAIHRFILFLPSNISFHNEDGVLVF